MHPLRFPNSGIRAKQTLRGGGGAAARRGSSPQGAATRKRATDCGCGARRKAACEQKHRPLAAASPQGAACPRRGRRGSACQRPARKGATPIEGTACGHGADRRGGCRWARATAACTGAATATTIAKGGKRARTSFKKKG
ncbi:hypothetical protein GW17_00062217 [Ensete ventricosum]|nr:hypothetical protein GW17_00062217 [Ensete ventricosum]